MIEGWVFDLYAGRPGEMVVWIKTPVGRCVRLTDEWRPSIYVYCNDRADLADLVRYLRDRSLIHDWGFEWKFREPTDTHRSRVLRLTLSNAKRIEALAQEIHRAGGYRKFHAFDVDMWPEQRYLYEKDLFPLAQVEAEPQGEQLSWSLTDNVESLEYEVPPLTSLSISVEVNKEGWIPSFHDPVGSITVEDQGERIVVDSGEEAEKLLGLVDIVEGLDPDVIYTRDGDSFTMPYLATRARVNQVSEDFSLSREHASLRARSGGGRSYFSYGKIYWKPPAHILLGRAHIDVENTHIFAESGVDGLIEVSRTCIIPLQRAARATIGTCMMSAKLHHAVKRGMLVPWRKTMVEQFKTARELLVADRGGFVFEPRVGVYEKVGEIDFRSMYPSIMASKNISGETVNCDCCPDSAIGVPEVGYHLCERRIGITPMTLKLLLWKRAEYKSLRDTSSEPALKARYDNRQKALKWILVCSFGYLSYRNAKFGRIDAHIAVCAFARKYLLDAAKIAERQGFSVVHGIVDSLWLTKPQAEDEDYRQICREVEGKIGLSISFEGLYRWIAFLPSKVHRGVPVLNRYYGVFEDGRIKARGLEVRRHDPPPLVKKCQRDILDTLAHAPTLDDVAERIPHAVAALKAYLLQVRSREASLEDLIITKSLSRNPEEYSSNVATALAARQLMEEGLEVSAGQTIRYLIRDHKAEDPRRRVIAAQLLEEDTEYDAAIYSEMLLDSAASVLAPFGYEKEKLRQILSNTKQLTLTL
ncbi:MAG: hypothetical protein OEW84_01120 [Aigarchaeota archaeon]|nr:hypothetical protein [Aigarchaeota archaeon]